MGSEFIIKAIGDSRSEAKRAVQAAFEEVERIENLISSWNSSSQTFLINKNAGIKSVKVDVELFDLIERSKKISKLTDGLFDITFASIDNVWQFDGSMNELPGKEDIRKSVSKINFENVLLHRDSSSVFLKEEGMKIGFGGIGKGYAANRCKRIMTEMGIESGVVNAGGDLITWGGTVDEQDWSIGIANPDLKNSALSYLNISDRAVVTSGNYERYAEIDGKKYCHIIHPKTGWPVEGLKSVTIICPDAEVADALATAVFVMGKESGLELINRLKAVECFIVDNENHMIASEGIAIEAIKKGPLD